MRDCLSAANVHAIHESSGRVEHDSREAENTNNYTGEARHNAGKEGGNAVGAEDAEG